jgi:hypothetical protein
VLGVVALLVITVAVVLLAGQRPPREYPAGSPEAAFQAYLVAWEAANYEAAYAAFTTAVRAATPLADYRRQAADFRTNGLPPGTSRRVFIDRTTITGDETTLDVTIEETTVNGLSADRYRYSRSFVMVREDGAWRFDRIFMGIERWSIDKLSG